MAPVPFGLVCFRYRPQGTNDEAILRQLNRELLSRINATRHLHLTHTELGGRYVIRMCIGQRLTGRSHVEEAWRTIQDSAESLRVRSA
jgi:aromatic-L-amino-acid decarboxylase